MHEKNADSQHCYYETSSKSLPLYEPRHELGRNFKPPPKTQCDAFISLVAPCFNTTSSFHRQHRSLAWCFPSSEASCCNMTFSFTGGFSATSSSHRQHQSKPQIRLQFNDAGLAVGDQCTVAQHASFPSRNPETQVFARISVLNSLLNHFQNHSWKPQKGPQAVDIQMTILATNPLKIGNECFK